MIESLSEMSLMLTWGCLVLVFSLEATATASPAYFRLLGKQYTAHGPVTSAPKASYTVKWYQQRLDHFNAAEQRTFQQRYLVNQDQWEGLGPILLYTGNEGDITWFCNNTVNFIATIKSQYGR